MDVKHYQNHTLVDIAYLALKSDIAEGTLLPGQKLITRELSERYGVSETPIKQALNRLISESLVENTPRKGMRVKDIDLVSLEELLDVRRMVETYYAAPIIKHFAANGDLQGRFRRNLDEHRQLVLYGVDARDHVRNYALDLEFHQMYIGCASNARIAQVYNNLGTHVYACYIYKKQSQAETIAGVDEHEDIYQALVSGSLATLQAAVETHLDNARRKITSVLRDR
ncbi:MAG: putative HTH-type transcriptional regulator LgoR [Firmicutes bacterium]|nr:putative HTH-type transcriptional regulator LgoR [candidate division NPL-UPA2 bacterium]MBT9153979.1 putative HTH-type transcriptional regulator LgoR [candidate division NPL-UPA2 bacterium]